MTRRRASDRRTRRRGDGSDRHRSRAWLAAGLAAIALAASLRLPAAGVALPFALAVAWTALHAAGSARRAALVATVVALGPASVATVAVAPLAPWSVPAVALALAAPFALVGVAFARTARSRVRSVLAVAGTWAALESAWGAPWLLGAWAMPAMTLGFAASSGPWTTWFAPAGPAPLTLGAWTAGAVVYAAASAVRRPRRNGIVAGATLAACGFVVGTVLVTTGLVRASTSDAARPTETASAAKATDERSRVVPVRIAQTAARASAQAAFALDPASAERRLADLVDRSAGPGAPDRLTIWPEGALPGRLDETELARVADRLPSGATVLAGAITERNGRVFNSAVALRGRDDGRTDGRARIAADKRRPVPLTERALTPGVASEPFLWRGTRLAIAICWEVAFPGDARAAAHAGADVLVVLADDAYAPVGPVPELHLRLARLRAAEIGRPVLFVQATGPSAAIGPDGTVWARAEPGDLAPLDVDLPVGVPPPFHPLRGAAPFGPPVAIAALLSGLLLPRPRLAARPVPPSKGGEAGGP